MGSIDWTNMGIPAFGFLCYVGLALWLGECEKAANKAKWEKAMAVHALPVSEELRLAREAFCMVVSANAVRAFPDLQQLGDAARRMIKEEDKRLSGVLSQAAERSIV
jgi:hypothetical protein